MLSGKLHANEVTIYGYVYAHFIRVHLTALLEYIPDCSIIFNKF